MGDTTYVTNWLNSPGLTAAFESVSDLFWGADLVASPLNSEALRKEGSSDPSSWWGSKLDAVVKLLPRQAGDALGRSPAAQALQGLMIQMFAPGHMPPRIMPMDLTTAAVSQLREFQQDLGVALKNPGTDPGLREAVVELRNASRTVGLGFIAGAATPNRRQPFEEVFDQLVVRDRAGWLHELVGKPPAAFTFGDRDKVDKYTSSATLDIEYILKRDGRNIDVGRSLRAAVSRYEVASQELKDDPKNERIQLRVTNATVALGTLGNLIASEAVHTAMDRPSKAAGAAVYAAVFSQAMRPILGVAAEKSGASALSSDPDILREFGKNAASEIRGDDDRLEDPTNPWKLR